MTGPVLAAGTWATNADLIADVAHVGHLRRTDHVLDPTWGLGNFWTTWRPDRIDGSDLDPAKSPTGTSIDFTDLPWPNDTFDAVVFDPPYKLNGTPTADVDGRYGVDVARTWQDRHALIRTGITEATRVLRPGGTLLVKCQDQVCSGKVRWQTHEFTAHAERLGHRLVDSFLIQGYRAQPDGRAQRHARRNYSTLLVLRLERPAQSRRGAAA